MTEDLNNEQKKLLVWRDYFQLLRDGIVEDGNGGYDDARNERDVATRLWLDVMITEIESEAMHVECDQSEYRRWEDVKSIAALDGNVDARD